MNDLTQDYTSLLICQDSIVVGYSTFYLSVYCSKILGREWLDVNKLVQYSIANPPPPQPGKALLLYSLGMRCR